MITRSKAPVRISFGTCGDSDHYTNLIGYGNGINATVDLYSYCQIHPREDNKIVLRSLETRQVLTFDNLEDISLGDRALNMMKVAILHYRNAGIEVVTYTDAPLESGLGGSAAHTVALIRAFDNYNNIQRSPEETAKLAYEWERNVLKFEGGYQDQWASAFGGINYMEFRNGSVKVTPLNLTETDIQTLENGLLLVFVPRDKHSSTVHLEQRQKGPESVPILHMKRENITKLRETLEDNRFEEIGKILNFDWKIKRQLAPSITNDKIEQIYEAAQGAGALGGRFIGAGAGGSAIFWCPGRKQEVSKVLESFGAKELSFKFERKSVKDESKDLEGVDMDYVSKMKARHSDVRRTIESLEESGVYASVVKAIDATAEAYRRNGTVFFCGNGGSASDALHFAGELRDTPPMGDVKFRAMSLADVSSMSAVGNDYTFEEVFSRQLNTMAREGDVLYGISTSGKAVNVQKALDLAAKLGVKRIGIVGNGPKSKEITDRSDVAIVIPSADTQIVQECYKMLLHDMWLGLKDTFGGKK